MMVEQLREMGAKLEWIVGMVDGLGFWLGLMGDGLVRKTNMDWGVDLPSKSIWEIKLIVPCGPNGLVEICIPSFQWERGPIQARGVFCIL